MTDICDICGTTVSLGGPSDHLKSVIGLAGRSEGVWLLTLNTEMLAFGFRDPDCWKLLQKADIITADGEPLVWASNFKFPWRSIKGRTTGADLVDALLRAISVPKFAVIGGTSPLATIQTHGDRAVEACAFVFDGMVDLSEEQLSWFSDELIRHQAQVVFNALGVPKQDLLALELRRRVPQVVLMGIGGTFEIQGPSGGRAPQRRKRRGLEWLYRLAKKPGRLWKRYWVNYPQGGLFLIKDCLVSSK